MLRGGEGPVEAKKNDYDRSGKTERISVNRYGKKKELQHGSQNVGVRENAPIFRTSLRPDIRVAGVQIYT